MVKASRSAGMTVLTLNTRRNVKAGQS